MAVIKCRIFIQKKWKKVDKQNQANHIKSNLRFKLNNQLFGKYQRAKALHLSSKEKKIIDNELITWLNRDDWKTGNIIN